MVNTEQSGPLFKINNSVISKLWMRSGVVLEAETNQKQHK